jgi:hypothetical protein
MATKKLIFDIKAMKDSTIQELTMFEYIPQERVDAYMISDNIQHDEIRDETIRLMQYDNEVKQLTAYKQTYKTKLGFSIDYTKKGLFGRIYPKKGIGLTSFRKFTRETFCHDIYTDFDGENMQPHIILQLCEANELPCKSLREYCDNRETILTKTMIDYGVERPIAKKLFTRLCFGGSFKGWKHDNNIDFNVNPTSFIIDYTNELKIIIDKVYEENPDIVKISKAKNKKCLPSFLTTEISLKTTEEERLADEKRSVMGIFSQHIECSIVSMIINHLKTHTKLLQHPNNSSILTGSYEYDGFRLYTKNVLAYKSQDENDMAISGIEAVLKLLNRITIELTGYTIIWRHKPCEDTIADLKNHIETINSKKNTQDDILKQLQELDEGEDTTRANKIIDACKDEIFFQEAKNGGVWFIWNSNENLWVNSSSIIHSKIIKHFCTPIEEDLQTIIDAYQVKEVDTISDLFTKKEKSIHRLGIKMIRRAKSTSGLNSTIKMLETQCYIKDFIRDQNIDVLGFTNGYLNYKDKSFCGYKATDRITLTTKYPFDVAFLPKGWKNKTDIKPIATDVKQQIDEVNDIFFNKILPEKDVRDYVLFILSTTLTGHNLHKFHIFNGGGRNGKGVLSSFMSIILGSNFYNESSPEMILHNNRPIDPNSPTSAMCMMDYKRAIYFKEPKSTKKYDNEFIKKLTGGDELSIRNMYGAENRPMNNHSTTIVECNSRLMFHGEVQLAERMRVVDVEFVSSFVDNQKDFDTYEKAGKYVFWMDAVKTSKENQNRLKLAALCILLEYVDLFYQNNFTTDFMCPEKVKIRTNDYFASNDPVIRLLELAYEWNYELDDSECIKSREVLDRMRLLEEYNGLDKASTQKFTTTNLNKKINEFGLTKESGSNEYGYYDKSGKTFKLRLVLREEHMEEE